MFKCKTCGNGKDWKVCLDKWHDQDIRVDIEEAIKERNKQRFLDSLLDAYSMTMRSPF